MMIDPHVFTHLKQAGVLHWTFSPDNLYDGNNDALVRNQDGLVIASANGSEIMCEIVGIALNHLFEEARAQAAEDDKRDPFEGPFTLPPPDWDPEAEDAAFVKAIVDFIAGLDDGDDLDGKDASV